MKIFLRVMYIFFAIVVSFFVFMFSLAKKEHTFFIHNMEQLQENYDRDFYIQTNMTYQDYLVDYLKDPLYLAVRDDEDLKFEFGLYSFKVENNNHEFYVLALYFKDFDIKALNDIRDNPEYKTKNHLVYIQFNIYYDEKTEPIDAYISTYYLDHHIFGLATVGLNDEDVLSYLYSSNREVKSNQLIREVDVILVNEMGEAKEEYIIAKLVHDDLNNNKNEDLLVNGISTNFNGSVDSFDVKDQYNNEELLGVLLKDQLKDFNYVVVRFNVIYYLILITITYLIFFFKPTIDFIKSKKAKI